MLEKPPENRLFLVLPTPQSIALCCAHASQTASGSWFEWVG